eukprot:TRINITY_DN14492_c0_g5_i1.p1 TRINITY_DN14492_c0_g5~~TRINITY_DN14492_c0_g5_i1.p1  ORF type:complete len:142 (+),score=4.21 TRINITY_DN14492_c0_g5_i1:124-549(+)
MTLKVFPRSGFGYSVLPSFFFFFFSFFFGDILSYSIFLVLLFPFFSSKILSCFRADHTAFFAFSDRGSREVCNHALYGDLHVDLVGFDLSICRPDLDCQQQGILELAAVSDVTKWERIFEGQEGRMRRKLMSTTTRYLSSF